MELLEPDTQRAINHLDNLLNDNQRLAELIAAPTLFHSGEKQHIASLAKRNITTQCSELLDSIDQLIPKLSNQSAEFQDEAMLLVKIIESMMTSNSALEPKQQLEVKLLQHNADWKAVVEEFTVLRKYNQLAHHQ